MSQFKFSFVFILGLLLNISPYRTIAQYTSVILPYDRNPNAGELIMYNDKIVLLSLNIVDDSTASSLLVLNEDLQLEKVVDYKNYLFALSEAEVYGEELVVFGQNWIEEDQYEFIHIDKHYEVAKRDTYEYLLEHQGGIRGFHILGEVLIGSIWDERDCDLPCSTNHLVFKNTDGEVLAERNYDDTERYFYAHSLSSSASGYLLTGGNIGRPLGITGSYAGIYKLDSLGNQIWKYRSTENQARGNVPVWTAELDNGDIIYTDKIDDPNTILQPTKIIWLSAEGDYMMEWVDEDYIDYRVEISGLAKDRDGAHFYAFGSKDGVNEVVGYIVKFDNAGQVIWKKTYQHSGYELGVSDIRDIVQLENGDIVTLGYTVIPGEKLEIWMMRLNEHGCFGTDSCADANIYTSTTAISEQNISLVPNPATDHLTISGVTPNEIELVTIFDMEGKQLSSYRATHIDVSRLLPGLYIVNIVTTDDEVAIRKFLKQ